jgi:hypothetical protein
MLVSINLNAHGRFGMMIQKMLKHDYEFVRMFYFSMVACFLEVLDDHRPDALGALRLVKEVTRQRGGLRLADVLMLADRGHLLGFYAAHCNAVIRADHSDTSTILC